MMRPMSLTPLSPALAHSPDIGLSSKPPWDWSRNEVSEWLLHCEREYSLDKIDLKRFAMNGKALYILTKQDFIDRLPSIGDVLYNHIHVVLEEARRTMCESLPPQRAGFYDEIPFSYRSSGPLSQPLLVKGQPHSPTTPVLGPMHHFEGLDSTRSPRMTVPYSYTRMLGTQMIAGTQEDDVPENLVMYERREDHKYLDMTPSPTSSLSENLAIQCQPEVDENMVSCREDLELIQNSRERTIGLQSDGKKSKADGRLLWDFLSNLLKYNKAPDIISWDDEQEDIFRIHDAAGLAVLWGRQKNRSNMTYEKMSRALRYYYKMNIIQKVKGKRLTYRFMKKPDEIRRNRGLALRCRVQQRKDTTHQNSLRINLASQSPSCSVGQSQAHQEPNKDICQTDAAISYVHLDEMKPLIGQSIELKVNSPLSPSRLDHRSYQNMQV
ncbi:ets DNA-binding protein pokkuri-like isoform X2 [Lineus longissimus]